MVNQNQNREVMTLDYERHGDEVAEAIEMLFRVEHCIVNPDLTGCGRVPDVIHVSISPRRDFVAVRIGDKRITYTRDKVIIHTGGAALLVDERFTLRRLDGSLEPRTSKRLTWHGTEEVFDAYEFRKMIRDAIVAIVDIARDALQS